MVTFDRTASFELKALLLHDRGYTNTIADTMTCRFVGLLSHTFLNEDVITVCIASISVSMSTMRDRFRHAAGSHLHSMAERRDEGVSQRHRTASDVVREEHIG